MPSHILVVEDERDLLRVITYNLKQAGFDVVGAPDGETALRAVREERFDIVLLDLMLPDISGTEVCRRLKSNPATASIPVVMVTAKGEEIDRIVGFELGDGRLVALCAHRGTALLGGGVESPRVPEERAASSRVLAPSSRGSARKR